MTTRYIQSMNTVHIIGILFTVQLAAAFTVHQSVIDWRECGDPEFPELGRDVECGYLSVPLDYKHPTGKKIQIAISRRKHKVSPENFQGIMLTNPGGPGSSGLSLATMGSPLPKAVNDAYDWIGFDPRGVGASKPNLNCMPEYHSGPTPDYIPSNEKLEKFWLKRAESYAKACVNNNSKLIPHLTTTHVVKDMESIRIALGQDQINFYGNSYGSYLGQVYATLFPKRVRRMVLDAIADPRGVWYKLNLDQCSGFDSNFRMWFRWLAKYNKNFRLGETEDEVAEKWNNVVKHLGKNPINGTTGPREWVESFLSAATTFAFWEVYGKIFSCWVNEKKFGSFYVQNQIRDKVAIDKKYSIYLSVKCGDAQWPKWEHIRKDSWLTHMKSPITTWFNTWYNAPCQYWPRTGHKPVHINGSTVGDILLLGATLDAPTAFEGSLEVRRRFPHARLIAVPGSIEHGQSLISNKCINNWVSSYLESGDLPPRKSRDDFDAECPSEQEPEPELIEDLCSEF